MRFQSGFLQRWVSILSAPFVLSACMDQQPAAQTGNSAAMAVEVPARIRRNAAIDYSQLSADLFVNNQSVVLEDDGSGVWAATAMVPAGRNSTVRVVWYEMFEGVRLKLAERSQSVLVGETGGAVNFNGTYATTGAGFDRDGDGFSNFDERTLGTSPLLSGDRPNAASMQLVITLPDDVRSLESGFTVTATRNGSSIPLLKNGDQYSATVSDVAAGSTVDFMVVVQSVKFGNLTLAREQRSLSINSGENSVNVVGADFSSLFDEDNDGATNLKEILRGRNPLAASDYVIATTSNSPLVDGLLSDYGWLGRLAGSSATIEPRLIDIVVLADSGFETTDGLRSEWAAVADSENLYVAVRVLDQSAQFDSGLEWWKDDGVEFFIDGDNSKLPDYDGINDIHMNFRLGDQSVIAGIRSAPLPANLVFEFSTSGFDSDIAGGSYTADLDRDGIVDRGFNLEFSIPLSEIDVQPGRPFGINVHYNDDDDGGDRDTKYVWIGELGRDVDYLDPSGLGTAEIQ